MTSNALHGTKTPQDTYCRFLTEKLRMQTNPCVNGEFDFILLAEGIRNVDDQRVIRQVNGLWPVRLEWEQNCDNYFSSDESVVWWVNARRLSGRIGYLFDVGALLGSVWTVVLKHFDLYATFLRRRSTLRAEIQAKFDNFYSRVPTDDVKLRGEIRLPLLPTGQRAGT